MPSLKTYDLFISHAWKYGVDYDKLVDFLNNAPYFTYRNYSSPKDKPLISPLSFVAKKTLQDAIERKIKPVNAVLILSGMYAAHREWMQFEIETAKKYKKPIIAIIPRGQQRIPIEVLSASITSVGWSTQSIVDAIRLHSI
ncbi:TIR domain-containing protein [Clostridium sp.]